MDHVAAALARVTEQFKDKPNYIAFLTALVKQAQPLEDALQQVITQRSIDTAVGVQLDQIGKKVGQPRNGLDDDTYRRYCRAKVAANRSHGENEDLLKVAALVVNDPAATFQTDNQGIATVVLRWLGTVADPVVANAVIAFLRKSVSAGVRVLLETRTQAPTKTLLTALTGKATNGIAAGHTRVFYITRLSAWPASGSFIVDQGDPALEETITYSTRTDTFINVSSTIAHNHAVNALCILQRTPSGGYHIGLGDEANPATGGHLARVQE